MQSWMFTNQDPECSAWLNCNMDPRKTASIINLQEQMVETRKWKAIRSLEVKDENCRLCGEYSETVEHVLAGCRVIAGTEYLRRHDNALKVLAVAWCKQQGILNDDVLWYKVNWGKGHVVEGNESKMLWDFEYKLRVTERARRPDLTLEDRAQKKIWIVDMACPQEHNISDKHREKLNKYQQLAFTTREKRPGYDVKILPMIIGCLGGGMQRLVEQVAKIIKDKNDVEGVCQNMQKTVLVESETIMNKVISGIIQQS